MLLSVKKIILSIDLLVSLQFCLVNACIATATSNTQIRTTSIDTSPIDKVDKVQNDKDEIFNADGAGGISTIDANKKTTETILDSLHDRDAQKMWQSKYLFLLQQSHLFDTTFPDVKEVGLQFQHARISLQYDKKYTSNMSISNLTPDACVVNFYFGLHNSTLMINNENENLTFMYLHELGHCLLGKDILVKGIPWSKEIKEQMGEDNVKKINQELVYASLSEINKQHQDTHHIYDLLDEKMDSQSKIVPLFAYHEIFADTQAMIWIAKMYPNEFESILNQMIQYRKTQFELFKKQHISYDHPSFYALEVLKQYVDKHPGAIFHFNALEAKNLALITSQIGFLTYLKEEKLSNSAF